MLRLVPSLTAGMTSRAVWVDRNASAIVVASALLVLAVGYHVPLLGALLAIMVGPVVVLRGMSSRS